MIILSFIDGESRRMRMEIKDNLEKEQMVMHLLTKGYPREHMEEMWNDKSTSH